MCTAKLRELPRPDVAHRLHRRAPLATQTSVLAAAAYSLTAPQNESEYLYAAYRLPSNWSTTVCAPCSGQENAIVMLESVSNGSVG